MWSINGILTKKKRSTAVEMCAQNYYKQGRYGVGHNNTGCPFLITALKNGDRGWRTTTIVADHNHDGTECFRCLLVNTVSIDLT
jgi:hypothetical protein